MDLTLRVMEQLEQREPPPGQTGAECVLLANLAYWHAMRGAPAAECLALARQALAGDVLLGEEGPASPSLSYAVLVLISADAFAEADAHLAAALARSRETGSVLGFTLTSLMRSMSGYRQGALADAEADARHATDTARLHGWGEGLPGAVGFLVDALVERGRLDEAAAALERAGFDGEVPPGLLFNAVLVARGRLAIARGQLAEGVEDLRELGRRSELEGARSIVGTPTWRSYAVPAMAGLGEREEAARQGRHRGGPGGGDRLARGGRRPARAGAPGARPRAGGPRRRAAPRAPSPGGARAPSAGPRPGRALRCRAARGARNARAGGQRRAQGGPHAAERRGGADPERAADCVDGGERHEQPRDRRGALPHPQDDRDAPRLRVQEARRLLPRRAPRGACGRKTQGGSR